MMDAVGEPDALGIFEQALVFHAVPISGIRVDNRRQQSADLKNVTVLSM